MFALGRRVIPVDQVVNVRNANERQVVFERKAKRFRRVVLAVGNLDAVHLIFPHQLALQAAELRDAVRALRRPVRVVEEHEGPLGIGRRDRVFRRPLAGPSVVLPHVALAVGRFEQRVRIVNEHGVDVAGRQLPGNLRAGNHDQVRVFRRVDGNLVSAVAIGVRDIGQVRLPFQMLGDREAVEPVAQRFFDADLRPDVTVRENAVAVQVDNKRSVAGHVRKVDCTTIRWRHRCRTMSVHIRRETKEDC